MSEALFTCVNCEMQYSDQSSYREHYKSDQHRYNVKRRLINLPPLGLDAFLRQFQSEMSVKQSSQKEIYCAVCSRKYMSQQTYRQHLNSKRHRANKESKPKKPLQACEQNSSFSSFEDLEAAKPVHTCLFCAEQYSEKHLTHAHNFPPFQSECEDPQGLINRTKEIIQEGRCLFCCMDFEHQESAKQHMMDVGHCKINTDRMYEFDQFYCWKIPETTEEEEEDIMYIFGKNTFEELENQRRARIAWTTIGGMINGREVGCRDLKQYYKQHLGRKPPVGTPNLSLTSCEGEAWRLEKSLCVNKMKTPKLCPPVNHR